MPRYMSHFSYTAQAWASLIKSPEDRRKPLEAAAKRAGGKILDLYYHFGDYDGTVIYEAPDDATASAVVLSATAAGHIKAITTARLFTMEETLEIVRKAGTVALPAPKG